MIIRSVLHSFDGHSHSLSTFKGDRLPKEKLDIIHLGEKHSKQTICIMRFQT